MKKYTVLCAGLCLAMAMTSCKTSESMYKKAYDKAKAYETAQVQQESSVVAPLETKTVAEPQPVLETKPATQASIVDNFDNVQVRQESVKLLTGSGLKAYSVVVSSGHMRVNAEDLQKRLIADGYNAQVVQSDVHGETWYRVIAETFDNKADAVVSRDKFRSMKNFEGAWLLYSK